MALCRENTPFIILRVIFPKFDLSVACNATFSITASLWLILNRNLCLLLMSSFQLTKVLIY